MCGGASYHELLSSLPYPSRSLPHAEEFVFALDNCSDRSPYGSSPTCLRTVTHMVCQTDVRGFVTKRTLKYCLALLTGAVGNRNRNTFECRPLMLKYCLALLTGVVG